MLWTDEQVKKLNDYQKAREFHPYTCGKCHSLLEGTMDVYEATILVATNEGWICPKCGYKQDWYHPLVD